jgi:hypothetical protein
MKEGSGPPRGWEHPSEVGNAHPQAQGLSVSGGRQTGNPIWTQRQGVVTTAMDVELEG